MCTVVKQQEEAVLFNKTAFSKNEVIDGVEFEVDNF